MSTRRSLNASTSNPQSPKELVDDTWAAIFDSTTSGPARAVLAQINKATRRIAKYSNNYIELVKRDFNALLQQTTPIPSKLPLNKDIFTYIFTTERFKVHIHINQGNEYGYRSVSGINVYDNTCPSDKDKFSPMWYASGSVRISGQSLVWNIYPDSNIFTLYMIYFILNSRFLERFAPQSQSQSQNFQTDAYKENLADIKLSWNKTILRFVNDKNANKKYWTVFKNLEIANVAKASPKHYS